MKKIKEKFRKFTLKLGFTDLEVKVVLFLITTFLVGVAAYYYKYRSQIPNYQDFDYSDEDSLFHAAGDSIEYNTSESKLVEKNVDSKQELLDFSRNDFSEKNAQDIVLIENSININEADINILIQLPGIGEVTALRIVDYRNQFGSFRNIDDLTKVKGIGKAKLNKIKKYIYVE